MNDLPRPNDLHVSKASHMALPISAPNEWHMKDEDDPTVVKPNDTAYLVTPVIVTSAGEGSKRYRQVGTPFVIPTDVFTSMQPEKDAGPAMMRKGITLHKK